MANTNGKMRRLADGIYERDGRKIVRWWEPDGKGGGSRKQVTLPEGTTLAEAKTFKGEKERDKRNGHKREILVEEFAEMWPVTYARPSRSTNLQNTERVSKFAKDFAGRTMREVDRAEARLWVNANPSRYKAVRAMFNDAMRDGFVDINPFDGVRKRQEIGRKDIVVPTEAEVERLIDIALSMFGEYGRVIAGMIGVAAWTGARPGELYALEWDDVDLINHELHITEAHSSRLSEDRDPKWNSKRTIALLPQAEAVLRQVPRHATRGLVFWTQRGSQFNSRNSHIYWAKVRSAFWGELPKSRKGATRQEAIRERKIPPDMELYTLRHFYGSYLANELGRSAQVIAKQMGHKDGGTLAMQLYVHTEQSDANRSVLDAARRAAERRRDDDEQQRKAS